ncbi:hypothetical protein [Oryza sativa Japonica Group]|uniref:Uncharacterized protein B1129G05.18 n=1 Tax=Oryza sativa subsp. japonica TaxID=39947 RepID=Q657B2_ORYSJ|nr:hypothetical protein [Oryza sativa Japonica Group]
MANVKGWLTNTDPLGHLLHQTGTHPPLSKQQLLLNPFQFMSEVQGLSAFQLLQFSWDKPAPVKLLIGYFLKNSAR